MAMNCAQFESVLADYLDGTLPTGQQNAFEEHLSTCSACRELAADAGGGLSFLRRVTDEVEPPPELITRIAYQAPLGRKKEPFERQTLLGRLSSKWLLPVLRPRLAMGMAMTILSFAMLERCTGVHTQNIQAADMNPVRVWNGVEDKGLRLKDRVLKYYDNLRIVYEIETRLKDLQESQDTTKSPAAQKKSSVPPKADSSRPEPYRLAQPSTEQRNKS